MPVFMKLFKLLFWKEVHGSPGKVVPKNKYKIPCLVGIATHIT